MSTASSSLTVGGIDVEVVYKNIKHLRITVYPPTGRVRVSAPQRLTDDHVRLAVIQRLQWIQRKQRQMRSAPRQSAREMVTGESHYVWGVRYLLAVVHQAGRPHVEVDGTRLVLKVPAGFTRERRLQALDDWYRRQLREAIPDLLDRWAKELGVEVAHWSIRRMKTRWGSCNVTAHRICFNAELAKRHPDCLEYVVVHELTHLLEPGHGKGFAKLMDEFLPDWRARQELLNAAPLRAEDWA